ncbi:hypothetical protein F2Q68_00040015 [Brassica cretica]|uniref:Uncharacterized protein n=1 Tax=Brassica cretica TaxID=69181 RepID=A0A8S9MDE4_BRACR|nr:hypothetical protein F2Q68_00040015 [Brassica cretica]
MVISKSTAMIISYSRISRKTFTERKIGSERTSESRTKATRRRAEPSRGSARRRAQPSRNLWVTHLCLQHELGLAHRNRTSRWPVLRIPHVRILSHSFLCDYPLTAHWPVLALYAMRKLEKAETRVLVSMTWTLETTVGDRRRRRRVFCSGAS